MTINCPTCDADVTDSYEPADYSVGINPGWYCETCDLGIGEHEIPREPLDGDVPIFATAKETGAPLGTPISQLSGRPGHPGFEEFCHIARTWGYD